MELTFLTNFRPEMAHESYVSRQPKVDGNQQSLAINATSESSFDAGNNNRSADAAPCDKPKSHYKCKF